MLAQKTDQKNAWLSMGKAEQQHLQPINTVENNASAVKFLNHNSSLVEDSSLFISYVTAIMEHSEEFYILAMVYLDC